MRSLFVLIHRWAGLFIAVFLFIAGATGAVISWDHEIDEWLNPHLFRVESRGPFLSPVDLASRVEAADPRRRVTFFDTQFEEGHAAMYSVTGRRDPATGQQFELGHNQVFIDPVNGQIVGTRDWGKVALDRENLLPFLYALHYSLHIPEMWGIDRWGVWFMGIVGIVWLFDSFVGLYLTLPARRRTLVTPALPETTTEDPEGDDIRPSASSASGRSWWQRWKPAWLIKWSGSRYRINFDLHRALGLWFWLLLITIAFTSISMNLQFEIVRPILSKVSSLTPMPWETREMHTRHDPIEPLKGYGDVIALAEREARNKGWGADRIGYAFYSPDFGIYAVSFRAADEDPHGAAGMVKQIMLDGRDGRILGDQIPWTGSAADVFLQLQFPIHSGRILGIPGRTAMSVFGVVVAVLSFTGVVIWFKKRAARLSQSKSRRPLSPMAAE